MNVVLKQGKMNTNVNGDYNMKVTGDYNVDVAGNRNVYVNGTTTDETNLEVIHKGKRIDLNP